MRSPAIQMLSKTRNEYLKMRKWNHEKVNFIFRSNYCSRILPIRWIFWKRLQVAISMLEQEGEGTALDFGAQMGVLLPSLSTIFDKVFGCDINDTTFEVNRELLSRLGIENVEVFVNEYEKPLTNYFKEHSLNAITAMDVLEHIPEPRLLSYLQDFSTLLTEEGRLIVSIPLENFPYTLVQKAIGHNSEESKHFLNYRELSAVLDRYFLCVSTKNLFFSFKVMKLKPRKQDL